MFVFWYLSYDIVCKVKHFFYNILVIFIYNISRYFLIHRIEGEVTKNFIVQLYTVVSKIQWNVKLDPVDDIVRYVEVEVGFCSVIVSLVLDTNLRVPRYELFHGGAFIWEYLLLNGTVHNPFKWDGLWSFVNMRVWILFYPICSARLLTI